MNYRLLKDDGTIVLQGRIDPDDPEDIKYFNKRRRLTDGEVFMIELAPGAWLTARSSEWLTICIGSLT